MLGVCPSRPADNRRPSDSLGAMGAGFVGILTFDIHLPETGSLKGKRRDLRSLKADLQHRFGAAVAEVDHHDLWQRAALTVACVARSAHEADELAAGAERWLASGDWTLVRCDRLLVSPGDED